MSAPESKIVADDGPVLPPPPMHHHLNLLGAVQGLLTVVVLAVFVITFVAQPFRIPSESMEPTLLIGDFVLVNKVVTAPAGNWHWLLPYRSVERGDVIVFRKRMQDEDEFLVKRAIAVPGDHVRLDRGQVVINGQPVKENYAVYLPSGPDAFRDDFPASLYTDVGVDAQWWVQMHKLVRDGALIVPEGDYFALGDNRNRSQDSRYWGFVDASEIVGEPVLVYFSVRTPSPDDGLLPQLPNDRMSKEAGAGQLNFARWDRMFHVVR